MSTFLILTTCITVRTIRIAVSCLGIFSIAVLSSDGDLMGGIIACVVFEVILLIHIYIYIYIC